MKKLSVIVFVLSICLLFASCAITFGAEPATENEPVDPPVNNGEELIVEAEETELSVEEPTPLDPIPEPDVEVEVETPPDVPNAKEFPEFEWPTFGAATKVPTPDWSHYGDILIDSEIGFWGQVGYTTLDDYTVYVKACQEAGYTEDYYSVSGYFYYGANEDGYAVQLTYNQYDHYLAVQVTAYASEWDKWWVEETETSTKGD